MTIEIFMILLAICSIVTGLLTECAKKLFDNKYEHCANWIALILGLVTGTLSTILYYIYTDVAFVDTKHIIFILLVGIASSMGAMLGYDKVIQSVTQIKSHE